MVNNDDALIGFVLVCAAGASTALGAAGVFFPRLVKLASPEVLAGALGISAGVMIYVSFIEIFSKSITAFEDAGESEADAYLYATLTFFGGILLNIGLDKLVHLLDGSGADSEDVAGVHGNDNISELQEMIDAAEAHAGHHSADSIYKKNESFAHARAADESKTGGGAGSCDSQQNHHNHHRTVEESTHGSVTSKNTAGEVNMEPEKAISDAGCDAEAGAAAVAPEHKHRLVKMGMMTAIAIALHNFPEGLATFIAALNDPSVGAALAIAIAIHNIPEGLCVSIPIYYATGSRTKGFLWALLSGISEPIAAGIGWAVLADHFDDYVFGGLFGVVAGMMVHICLHELLPTALLYDPKNRIVSPCIIVGFMIMALSLVLFVKV